MSHHEIAIPIGSGIVLPSERPPYGCDLDERIAVNHDPVHGELADCARALFYTRRLAEDLAHNNDAAGPVRNWAEDVARYSNDLEFFTRQIGLGIKMPVMVDPPYLPVDMSAMPLPLLFMRPPISHASGIGDNINRAHWSRLNRRAHLRRCAGNFL